MQVISAHEASEGEKACCQIRARTRIVGAAPPGQANATEGGYELAFMLLQHAVRLNGTVWYHIVGVHAVHASAPRSARSDEGCTHLGLHARWFRYVLSLRRAKLSYRKVFSGLTQADGRSVVLSTSMPRATLHRTRRSTAIRQISTVSARSDLVPARRDWLPFHLHAVVGTWIRKCDLERHEGLALSNVALTSVI